MPKVKVQFSRKGKAENWDITDESSGPFYHFIITKEGKELKVSFNNARDRMEYYGGQRKCPGYYEDANGQRGDIF